MENKRLTLEWCIARLSRFTDMKASTKKAVGFVWLGMSIFLGGAASAQFACMLLGVYDPVRDDHMSPDSVLFARAWLGFLIIAFSMSALLAYRYVRRTNGLITHSTELPPRV